jgi:hypothetical protein
VPLGDDQVREVLANVLGADEARHLRLGHDRAPSRRAIAQGVDEHLHVLGASSRSIRRPR